MQGPPPELRRGGGLNNRSTGARGEEIALRFLTRRGYELVERNYRTRYGEIDLVLRKQETLVFVEVKLRRGTAYGEPVEAVTPRKQAALRSMAKRYLADRDPDFDTIRFDVVGILLDKGKPRIRYVQDAF